MGSLRAPCGVPPPKAERGWGHFSLRFISFRRPRFGRLGTPSGVLAGRFIPPVASSFPAPPASAAALLQPSLTDRSRCRDLGYTPHPALNPPPGAYTE